jgi:hypothetical protein
MGTGGKILTDIAENQSPDVSMQDIISKNLSESAQNLFTLLQGRGRKRKRKGTTTSKAKKASKKRKKSASKSKSKNKRSRKPKNAKKQIKRDIFS